MSTSTPPSAASTAPTAPPAPRPHDASLPAPLQPPPGRPAHAKRPRKQRQPISCTECRQRKLKCDRRIPGCSACIKRKLPLDRCKFGDERDHETPEQRAARLRRLEDGERRRAQRKAAKAARDGLQPYPDSGAAQPHDDDDDSSDSEDDEDDPAAQKRSRVEGDLTHAPPAAPAPASGMPPATMPMSFPAPAIPSHGNTPSAAAHAQLAVHARNQAARIQAQVQARAAQAQAQVAAAAAAALRQFSSYQNGPTGYEAASSSPHTGAAGPPAQNGLQALITALGSSDPAFNGLPETPLSAAATAPGLSANGSPASATLSSGGASPHYVPPGPRSQSHHRPSSPRRAGMPAFAIVAEAAQLRRASSMSRLPPTGAKPRQPVSQDRPWRIGNEHTTELLDALGNQDTTSAVLGLQRLYQEGRPDQPPSAGPVGSEEREDKHSVPSRKGVRLDTDEGHDEGSPVQPRHRRSASSPVFDNRLHRGSLSAADCLSPDEEARGRARERPRGEPDIAEERSGQTDASGDDPHARKPQTTRSVSAHNSPIDQRNGEGRVAREAPAPDWSRQASEPNRNPTPAPSATSTHPGSASATPGPGVFPGVGLGGLGMGQHDGNANALLAIGEKVLQKSSLKEAKAKTRALALLPGKPQTVQLINMYLEELGMITPFVRVDFVMKELDLLYDSVADCFGSKGANVLPTIVENGPDGMMRQRLVDPGDANIPAPHSPRPAAVVQPVVGTGPGAGEPQPRLTFLAYVLFALSAIVELLPSTTIISFNLVRSSEQISTLLHDWLDTALECLEANELAAHPSLEGVQASLVAVITLAHRFRHEDLLKLLDASTRAARRLGLDRLGSAADTPPYSGQSPAMPGGPEDVHGVGAATGPAPRPDLYASLDKSQRKLAQWWVDPDVQMSMDNLEIGRAVWSALAMTDWNHSGLNGSYSVRPYSYTTCPPYAPAPRESSRRGMPSPHDAWLGLLEAADVARQVQELTIQAEVLGQEVDYQEVLKLDAKLHSVLAQRAWTRRETDLTFGQEELKNNLDIKRLQKQASLIRATVHYRTLKLHRPFMSKGYRYPDQPFVASVPRALDSARQLVIEARLMTVNDWISRRDRIQRYYLFQACLAMITDLWYRPRTFYPLFISSSQSLTPRDPSRLAVNGVADPLHDAGVKSPASLSTGEEAAAPKTMSDTGTTPSTPLEPSVIGFDSPEETREMEDNLTWIIDRLKDEGQAVEGSVLHGVSKNLERLMAATVQRGLQQQMLRSQNHASPAPPQFHEGEEAATTASPHDPLDTAHLSDAPPIAPSSMAQAPGAPASELDGALQTPNLNLPSSGAHDDEMVQLMDARLSRLADMTPQTWSTQLGGLGGLGALAVLGGLAGPSGMGDLNSLSQLGGLGAISQLSLGGLGGGLALNSLQALQQLQQIGALQGIQGLQQNLQSLAGMNLLGAAGGTGQTMHPSTSAAPSLTPTPAPMGEWPGAAAPQTPGPNHVSASPGTPGQGPQELMSYFLVSGRDQVHTPAGTAGATPAAATTAGSGMAPSTPGAGRGLQPSPALAPAGPSAATPSSAPGVTALDSATHSSMFPPGVAWEQAWTELFDTLEGDTQSVAGGSSLSGTRPDLM